MNVKKIYPKPETRTIDIEMVQIIASSAPNVGFSDNKVDNNSAALGRERRGSYGNLWEGEE